MRYEPVRHTLGLDLVARLAEGERLALGEYVREQQVVLLAQRIEGLGEGDEIAVDEPGSLVKELVEGMLAVGSGLAPIDRAGVAGHRLAAEGHALAVALHRELLQ